MNLPNASELESIYGESTKSSQRFEALAEKFRTTYHHKHAEFFSAPGRTEIIGNHTDHNGGRVIAASIDMDTIGAAYTNNSNIIRVTSEGYDKEIVVDLDHLEDIPKVSSTEALLGGLMEGIQKLGFKTGGFDACLTTNVIRAAGVSSSASFEMLICSIVNYFFNAETMSYTEYAKAGQYAENVYWKKGSGGVSSSASFEMLICSIVNYFFNAETMSYTEYAKAGQYAENVYWKKGSGLMDQLACAVGGPILLDFSNRQRPKYEKMDFSFHSICHQLIIVNTGKGHADLSREYSEIPTEMKEAAAACGAELLCETTIDQLLNHIPEIKNDRAILRAIHFFKENERVEKAADAIKNHDGEKFLRLLSESGSSSWELLQNCYTTSNAQEQKISLVLALTDLFLKKLGRGVCRIHGGGFAGVIMCIVPQVEAANYISYISKFVGKENVYPMNLRSVGAVHFSHGISPFSFH